MYFAWFVKTKTPSLLCFFREGAVSFWNINDHEIQNVLTFLTKFERDSYPLEQVEWENEHMEYSFQDEETKFHKGLLKYWICHAMKCV